MEKLCLGIELGSTRIKAVAVDGQHTPVSSGDYIWASSYENGVWTYSLDEVWKGLKATLSGVEHREAVCAMGVSAMMHGYLAFDKDWNLLTPFRTWQNTVTGQAAAELTPETLALPLLRSDSEYLPWFGTTEVDLAALYRERLENVGRCGWGVYAGHHMFCLDGEGRIVPVGHPDTICLEELVGYERERGLVLDNLRALLEGRSAANMLLTGDAGTGKSSTVKAAGNALKGEGLRIIEVRRDQLGHIPALLDELSGNPLKFILFIDDLSFRKDDDSCSALKAVLEGSVSARSRNVILCATSNRRHIVKEKFSDREGDDVHRNDAMQEAVSLADRFGLHVTFQRPGKDGFLAIVHALAQRQGVDGPEVDAAAERFALLRGGRSPRLARQFVDSLTAVRA